MKSRIIGFLFGGIFAIVPIATLIWSIWYAIINPDLFGATISILACVVGILVLTPIGIIMLKGVIKNGE